MLTQLRTTRLYERVSSHEAIHQFVKYALIGGLNLVLHLGIFNLLDWLGVQPLLANAIGFFVGNVNSFIWNKFWAFRDRRNQAMVRQYLRFAFFTLVGLGLHSATFALWLIPLDRYGNVGENLAVLLALPLSVVWNFVCYRLWTFKPGAARAPVEA